MKKMFLISFACYLLLNTIGYQVYAHFCGDILQETSLVLEVNTACCPDEDGNSKPDECCTEESTQFILKDNYLKTQVEQSSFINVFVLILSNINFLFQTDDSSFDSPLHQNCLVSLKNISPQVLLQNFRI